MAAPFLKWAGGKGKLAPILLEVAPPWTARYHEPFLGAGAVFFGLEASGRIGAATLNDLNEELIETWCTVRDDAESLIAELVTLAESYLGSDDLGRARLYYEVRAARPMGSAARAARTIFLNRTCFNGLYRVNRKGEFNVPHGDYANPRILDAPALRSAAAALRAADFTSLDFEDACSSAEPGDLVYLDPPYQPLSATSNFTGYTSREFGAAEQERLASAYRDLTRRGVSAILSNASHPFVESLYQGFEIQRVSMKRAINSVGQKRGPVDELLVTNFVRVGYFRSSCSSHDRCSQT